MQANLGTWTRAMVSLGLLVLLTGCVCAGECATLTDMVTETRSVALGGAKAVDVTIDMSIGEVVIEGGAKELLEASFEYNVAEWRPEIEYSEIDGRGVLRVTQPEAKEKDTPSRAKNRWTLAISDDVPVSLSVDVGVGEAELLLSSLSLTELDVDQGVGKLVVDLSGRRTADLDVDIDGGVGKAVLRVPAEVGVRVDGDMGIGSFTTSGLTKRDGAFVNEAYDSSESTIDVRIEAGIGSIRVEVGGSGLASI